MKLLPLLGLLLLSTPAFAALAWTDTQPKQMIYPKAKKLCRHLNYLGLQWRLPTLQEFLEAPEFAKDGTTYFTSTLYHDSMLDWTDDAIVFNFRKGSKYFPVSATFSERRSVICVTEAY